MATKKSTGARVDTIHCPSCGEDYAATLKYCPFCDWAEEEQGGDEMSGTGRSRKTPSRRRGGGYSGGVSIPKIVGITVSLALIIAAIWIVISVVQPLVDNGQTTMPDEAETPVETVEPTPTPTPTPEPTEVIPADQTATSFTLNYTEFSLSNSYPTPVQLTTSFAPAGTTGYVTWESSDPDVATVNDLGLVSYGTTTGTTTITATMAGGYTQTCLVRSSVTLAASSSSSSSSSSNSSGSTDSSSGSTSTSLILSHEDVTLGYSGETFTMTVSGNSDSPTWSVGNSGVATVSSSGQVTAVGTGSTTIYCEVDGQSLTCIIRCSW